MDTIKDKINTAMFVLRNGGIRELVFQTRVAINKRIDFGEGDAAPVKDVLILTVDDQLLNRYRTEHMIEELESTGVSVDSIPYHRLTIDHVRRYSVFIFYRCAWMPNYGEFFNEARKRNKVLIYSVDDLVIDTKYTDDIPSVKDMSKSDKELYDEGINRHKRVMLECDYAIVTTNTLADELLKYDNIKRVYIDRNAASEEMISCANKAISSVAKDENKVVVGYFSGTHTHNEDFQMVASALVKVMEENESVYIKIAGRVDPPEEFKGYEDRIIYTPYVDWRKLPFELRQCDIILAPLIDTIFNRAKSEIKWMEAALVGVPVIASNMGSFKDSIENGVTSILVDNDSDEWYKAITNLVNDADLREKISLASRDKVLSEYRTIGKNATGLRNFVREIMPNVYCFAASSLADISGGNIIVRRHIDVLRKMGNIVYVVEVFEYIAGDSWVGKNARDDAEYDIFRINSRRRGDKVDLNIHFDKAIATYWQSVKYVDEAAEMWPGGKKMYLVQGKEHGFFEECDPNRMKAVSTYYKDLHVITVSDWCKQWLNDEFSKEAIVIRNGVDIDMFEPKRRDISGKIKLLIEGDSMSVNKRVDESFMIANRLDKTRFEVSYMTRNGVVKDWYNYDNLYANVEHSDVGKIYRSHDILLKSSVEESFSLPPLEMMATGGVVVVASNGGIEMYAKDQGNCVMYTSGDIGNAVDAINALVKDRGRFDRISNNGKRTAEDFSWKNLEKDIKNVYES